MIFILWLMYFLHWDMILQRNLPVFPWIARSLHSVGRRESSFQLQVNFKLIPPPSASCCPLWGFIPDILICGNQGSVLKETSLLISRTLSVQFPLLPLLLKREVFWPFWTWDSLSSLCIITYRKTQIVNSLRLLLWEENILRVQFHFSEDYLWYLYWLRLDPGYRNCIHKRWVAHIFSLKIYGYTYMFHHIINMHWINEC